MENQLFYENNSQPPPIIDFVWKLLIQNTKIYKEFWMELWEGIIDRYELPIRISSDPQFSNKISIMRDLTTDYDNILKLYKPIWSSSYNNEYHLSDIKYSVLIRMDIVDDNFLLINKILAYLQKPTKEKLIKSCEIIYNKIVNLNNNSFDEWLDETIDDIQDLKGNKNSILIFKKLLSAELPLNLLSRFEQIYCISNSNAIIIMIEYFKFLTICKVKNEIFYPSKWVNQFWQHHMTFNTKQYRDFWRSLFDTEIDYQEYNFHMINKEDIIKLNDKSKRFMGSYFEIFGKSPPEWIWSKPCLDSYWQNEEFIFINIYKTIILKAKIHNWNVRKLK